MMIFIQFNAPLLDDCIEFGAKVELEMKWNGCVTWLSAVAEIVAAASAALNLKPTENWSPLFVHAIVRM